MAHDKGQRLRRAFGRMQDAEQAGILAGKKEGCLGHEIMCD
jgi:hypothetical protein